MKKIIFENKWYILSGLVIILLGISLRLYNLTLIPVFGDEAIYIRWSQVMNSVPSLRFLPLSDGKQPLYMWILMFLVNRFTDPLWIGRMVSVVSGIITFFGIGILSHILFSDKKISLISMSFWAVSPFALFYDRLALVDSLLTLFFVWTFIFGVLASKKLRLDYAMLAGFLMGFAALTKSPALLLALLYPATYILSSWPERKTKEWIGKMEIVHLVKLVLLTFTTYIIAYGMYNILRLGDNFQLIGSRNLDYVYPYNHIFNSPLDPLVPNLQAVFDWIWRMGPGLISVFALLFIIQFFTKRYFLLKKRIPANIAFVFILFVIPILINAEYAKVLAPRYILYSIPFLYIFSALFFKDFDLKTPLMKKVLVFGLSMWTAQALAFDYKLLTNPKVAALPKIEKEGFLEEWTSGYGIKESSEIIVSEYKTNPQNRIVVGTEGYFGTLPNGLQMYLNPYPEITIIGVGIDLKEMPKSLLESKVSGNSTYLLINSTRLLFKPEKYNLGLVAAFPKKLRTEGTRMYNLYGPQEILYLYKL